MNETTTKMFHNNLPPFPLTANYYIISLCGTPINVQKAEKTQKPKNAKIKKNAKIRLIVVNLLKLLDYNQIKISKAK